jgi:hypothetical protein
VRVKAQDVGTEAQRESGKALYLKNCSQCHGDKGDGEGYATPHSVPGAPQLHDGQVQGADDSQRSAPDASGPGQHHQTRHAVHVNARLGRPSPIRKYRVSPTSSRPSPQTSRTRTTFRSQWTCRALRARAARRSRWGRNSMSTTVASSATATSVGPTDLRPATLTDELGRPIRPADLSQPWTFRGGTNPRGHLQDDEHGVERHAHAVVR